MWYLIAPPPGIPHDVDDRAETTDTSVVSVQSTFDVVVKLGADLDTRSLSYTEHERRTRRKILRFISKCENVKFLFHIS